MDNTNETEEKKASGFPGFFDVSSEILRNEF